MTKIGRNQPCPCGSGQKYKKCCMGGSRAQPSKPASQLSFENFREAVRFQPVLVENPLGKEEKFQIIDTKLVNGCIMVEFQPQSTKPIDIRIEMGSLIPFIFSLYGEDGEPLWDFPVANYGAKALDEDGNELMYVVSSKQAAHAASIGDSIGWLNGSLFSDNTLETRLTNAKLMISRIETGLRNLILRRLNHCIGSDWWDHIDQNIQISVKKVYQANFGKETLPTAGTLIKFTFLPQLKTIICDNWTSFALVFGDQPQFEKRMQELNGIRRDESHNREITYQKFRELSKLYEYFASVMCSYSPEMLPEFLEAHWRSKMEEIFKALNNDWQSIDDHPPLPLAVEVFSENKEALKRTHHAIAQLVAPPQKTDLHSEIQNLFTDLLSTAEQMIVKLKAGDMDAFEDAAREHQETFAKMKIINQKIRLSSWSPPVE